MGVNVYYSTDASAPVLSGEVGSLVNLLDKCLVDGYGAKSPLGWSKAFSGTNKAAYRPPLGTNRFYLRVDDSAPAVTTARQALIRGYELMTDVDTGTGPFPSPAQFADGLAISKSISTGSTARAWVVIGDEACFYVFSQIDSAGWSVSSFGDIASPFKPGDAFHTGIQGVTVTTSASVTNLTFHAWHNCNSQAAGGGIPNHYMAREYNQVGGPVQYGKNGDDFGGADFGVGGGMPFPAPHDNGVYMSAVRVITGPIVRGYLPGCYQPWQERTLPDLTVLTDVANLPGRSVLVKNFREGSNDIYCAFFDITGPWR